MHRDSRPPPAKHPDAPGMALIFPIKTPTKSGRIWNNLDKSGLFSSNPVEIQQELLPIAPNRPKTPPVRQILQPRHPRSRRPARLLKRMLRIPLARTHATLRTCHDSPGSVAADSNRFRVRD